MADERKKYIGKRAFILVRGLKVAVEIKDLGRDSKGMTTFLLAPVAGVGQAWFDTVFLEQE